MTIWLERREHFGSFQTLSNIIVEAVNPPIPVLIKEEVQTNYDNTKIRVSPSAVFSIRVLPANGLPIMNSFPVQEFAMCNQVGIYPCSQSCSYSLTSANDMPGRDPKSWKLYGSADGKSYDLLDNQSGVFWADGNDGKSGRNKTLSFPLKTDKYTFFKLEITELIDNRQKPQLAELSIDASLELPYSDYARTLDIDNAIHTVTYKEGGITFKREYFMSYPDHVMVMRLTSDANEGNFRASFLLNRCTPIKSLQQTAIRLP